MSLEDAIRDLTAATEKHTAALEQFMKAAKAGTAAKAEAPSKSEDKPAKTPAKAAKKSKQPWETEEGFLSACGEYLKAAETKEDRARIRGTVQPILDHFGVEKFSAIGEDQREEAYGYVTKLHEALKDGGLDAAEEVDLELGNEDGDEGGNDDLV